PWGLSVNAYSPIRGQPARTLFHWHQFSWNDAKFGQRDARWQMHDTDAEDVDALSQVARGIRSGFAPRGRFSAAQERGPHWFHRLVAESVTRDGGPRTNADGSRTTRIHDDSASSAPAPRRPRPDRRAK